MPQLKLEGDLAQKRKVVATIGDERWGEYDVVSVLQEEWQVPEVEGGEIFFPVEIEGTKTIVRYSGSLPRGPAMFVIHKAGCPLIPLTDELKKIIEIFDRHDELSFEWMIDELGVDATLGPKLAATFRKIQKEFPGFDGKKMLEFIQLKKEKEREK